MIKHIETQLLDELEKYTWPCSVKEINDVMVKKNAAKDLLSILEISYRNKVRRGKPFSINAIHASTAV